MKFFKSLDFFTKAKEEVDSSTSIGGLFSLLGLFFGVLFFLLEFSSFMTTSNVTEMSIKNDVINQKENVNLDIWFPKAPCHILCLTQEEDGGISEPNVPVHWERVDSAGKNIQEYVEKHDMSPDAKFAEIAAAIANNESCRIHGNFSVSEIPGNFRFDYKRKIGYYRNLSQDQAKAITFDFVLHHLTFGSDSSFQVIRNKYPKENFTPYDGLTMKDLQASDKVSIYSKIVSHSYITTRSSKAAGFPAFQFSARYQKKDVVPLVIYLRDFKMGRIEPPSFQINYEFSPIHIKHKIVFNPYSRFLVDALAIVGGIFSVMGMLNHFVLTKWKNLRRL